MLNAVSSGSKKEEDEEAMELFGLELDEDHSRQNKEDMFEDDDFENPTCEPGGVTKPKRHPGDPTREEVEDHNLIHCPYRSWCPECIESQRSRSQGGHALVYRSAGA